MAIKKRLGSLLGPEGRTPQFSEGQTRQVESDYPAKVDLVRINDARYRLDFDIPQGRQGLRGLPGVNAVPADEAVATYLAATDTQTHRTFQNSITSRVAGLGPSQLYGAQITERDVVSPFDMIDGVIWGSGGGNLYTSTNGGLSWTNRGNAPTGTMSRIGLTPDGGAILLTSDAIYKTADISTSPVWEQKATTNGPCQFLGWSLAGDGGNRWITTEYAAGASFPYSRYVRMTKDGGNTWEIVYDSVEMHGQEAADGSHLHGCAYDPWADRWIVSEGHSNTGDIAGLYVSEDDGATWFRADGMKQSPAPTMIVATDNGLVCSSDHAEGGVYGVVRTAISRQELRRVWAWRPPMDGVAGFGQHGYRDPETGVVYFGYQSASANFAPFICGGTATGGGMVWEWPTASDQSDAINRVFPLGDGEILANARIQGGLYTVRGKTGSPTVEHPTVADTGNTLGGTSETGTAIAVGIRSLATGMRCFAAGLDAEATGSQESTALGYGAQADYSNSTAVGALSRANSLGGTAIGRRAEAQGSTSIAIGHGATSGNGAIAIGSSLSAGSSSTLVGSEIKQTVGGSATAVGWGSTIGNFATALGVRANANADRAVALGADSNAGAWAATLGADANASHTNSVALGRGTQTTQTRQVALGERHIQLLGMSATPNSPPEGGIHLYAQQNSAGKTVLYARFSTGERIELAVQP